MLIFDYFFVQIRYLFKIWIIFWLDWTNFEFFVQNLKFVENSKFAQILDYFKFNFFWNFCKIWNSLSLFRIQNSLNF
jgi:hypothetical protein